MILLLSQIIFWSWSNNYYYPEPPTYRDYSQVPSRYYESKRQFNNQYYKQQDNMAALVERKRYHRLRKLAYLRGY